MIYLELISGCLLFLKQREVSLWKDNSKFLLGLSFWSGYLQLFWPTDVQIEFH